MNPQIFLSKTLIPQPLPTPFLYFDGPVAGGAGWQIGAFNHVCEIRRKCCNVAMRVQSGSSFLYSTTIVKKGRGAIQNDKVWEKKYRKVAMCQPRCCLLIWLPTESARNPRHGSIPYGTETRYFLMRVLFRLLLKSRSYNFVIGAEPGFPEIDSIRCEFQSLLNGEVIAFHPTLEETLDAALLKVAA